LNLIVSVIVGFLTISYISLLVNVLQNRYSIYSEMFKLADVLLFDCFC
jgi:hypothetical protein